MMMGKFKPLVIYHHQCSDGMAAAWVVWRYFEGEVEFYPGVYNDTVLPDVTDRRVFIVDFSYSEETLRRMAKDAISVTVLDHHKTANHLPKLIQEKVITGFFNMDHCGATLTWKWFYPDRPVPILLKYVEDRDLYRNQLPSTKEIIAGLRARPLSVMTFEKLIGLGAPALEKLKREGAPVLRNDRKNMDSLKEYVIYRDIAGWVVPTVNAPGFYATDLAGELAENEPFAAVYWEHDEGCYTYSLRSRKPDGVDVGEIAKSLGGGGHKHAAGFTTKGGI